jgi:rubredoxin
MTTTDETAMLFPKPTPRNVMKKYVCGTCGYVYDPAKGDPESAIPPGTPFEKLPSTWVCPECGVGKDEFSPQ